MAKREAPHLSHEAALESTDPWRRFERGGLFAQELARGREQEVLWLLCDGIAVPGELLGRALCSAAYQGMGRLCAILGPKLSGSHRWPCALAQSKVGDDLFQVGQRRYRPAILAMLGGHPELAMDLIGRHGPSIAFEKSTFALDYSEAASAQRSRGPARIAALAAMRQGVHHSEWALAANFLCVAGGLDAAYELLEAASPWESSRVARAMLAPLCAYSPNDPDKESALIVLERAVGLAEGRSEKSISPWSPWEIDAISKSSWSKSSQSARASMAASLCADLWRWAGPSMSKAHCIHPRAAAAMCGNSQALALMEGLEWTSAEVESLRACAQTVLSVVEKTSPESAIPTLLCRAGPLSVGLASKAGLDPVGWARAALAIYESRCIGLAAKEGVKKAAKAARRGRKAVGPDAVAEDSTPVPSPRRVRL